MSTRHHQSATTSTRRSSRTRLSLLAAAPLLLTACGGTGVTPTTQDETAGGGETVEITNCGRELTFEQTPAAVVGLMPSQTDLLLRLGVQDQLVGQAQVDISDLPDDTAAMATDVPTLSEDSPPAREDLLAVSPDLVTSPTEYEFTAEQGFASIEQLSANGAQAYVATGGCAERRSTAEVSDLFTDIDNLGRILGATDEADELAEEAQARLDSVTEAISGEEPVTVAQVWVEGNLLGAIGAGIEYDIIRVAGGDNVFDPDAPEFANFFAAEINPEEVVERDPQAIVFGAVDEQQAEEIRAYLRTTFPDVTAVQDDVLIAVPQSDLYPGSVGNVGAVEIIAEGLYPNAF